MSNNTSINSIHTLDEFNLEYMRINTNPSSSIKDIVSPTKRMKLDDFELEVKEESKNIDLVEGTRIHYKFILRVPKYRYVLRIY